MAARSHEVAWVAALLECLPQVDVLGVRIESDWLHESVPMLVLDVHAAGWSGGLLLAEALRLREFQGRTTEGYDGGEVRWRNWSGWAAEGSHEVPVWVEVTAAERAADVEDAA